MGTRQGVIQSIAQGNQPPTGWNPDDILETTENSDLPNNYDPGFTVTDSGQVFVWRIDGNSSDIEIETIDRSLFEDGAVLRIINSKGGSAKITWKQNTGSSATNRQRGSNGDAEWYRGAYTDWVSNDSENRWAFNGAS